MSITFLNPLLLFGLAAAILPILIHRLTRRKAVRRKFAAVRLLLRSRNVMSRPQRLKHLLLLALRVTAILALVFMAARPALVRPGLLARGEQGSKILIIDNSMSMGFGEAQGTRRYEHAKRVAREIISAVKGDILIIPTAPVDGVRPNEESSRWAWKEAALKELDAMPLSFGRGDPGAALTLALRRQREMANAHEILVISDMARTDWQRFDPARLGIVPGDMSITFVRIGDPARDANTGVASASLSRGEAVVGVPVRLQVIVANHSDRAASTVVQFFIRDAKVDQKSIELPAGGEGKASFDLRLDRAGWVNAQVRLSGDSLPYDDLFYVPLNVREKIRVLVVDGDPRGSIRAGESYYLVRALRPAESEESPFQVTVATEKEFTAMDAGAYEVLFLLNVERPDGSRLAAFVDAAKPVFIFLGDRVSPEAYNSMPHFPWRIRETREAAKERPYRIARVDSTREVLKEFSRTGEKSLEGASFRQYYRIEGSGRTLLALDNQDLLLAEAAFGKGSLFLFASSADIDWNDLALKAAFVPLVQGLAGEAVAGALTRSFTPAVKTIGDPIEGHARATRITGPEGGPGIYGFPGPAGEVRFAVNTPPEESELAKMSDDEIRRQVAGLQVTVAQYKEGSPDQVRGGRQDLWPYVLGFLLVILGTELGVAARL